MISDCQKLTLDCFNGAWNSSGDQIDATRIPLNNGLDAQNCAYLGCSVSKRYGFGSVFTPGDNVTAMLNWIFLNGTTPANYLAWMAVGIGIRIANLASPSASTIMTQASAACASICVLGSRLYVGFMDANGVGMAAGQIYGFGVGADPLFAAPIATTPTFSEPGGTFTTIGPKLFGYLIQTRNGAILRPSPAPSSNFTPTSYTSLGGAILMSVDPPGHVWPTYASLVAPIMTTTANPTQFFIVPSPFPGQSPWTAVNLAAPTVMLIESTDDQLVDSGIDATPYLNQLGNTISGTAPVNPSVIFPYGQRLGYVTLDSAGIPVVYFSDSSNYQSINAASSGVYLPGQLRTVTAFALRGICYMMGPHWTYSTADTGDVPVRWAQPQLVDGGIGAAGPFCVSLNASQNYAWVANQGGLYLFTGGSYPSMPVSYWQSGDWARINFAVPTKIKVEDNATEKTVCVMAPLDGATSPTHILTWDYSMGAGPEEVQYSLQSIAGYGLGNIAVTQNSTSKCLELWTGPSSGSYPVGRQKGSADANPYRDFANGIDATYETAPLPRGMAGRMVMHHGANVRATGAGALILTVYGLDHSNFTPGGSIPLTETPGIEYLKRFFMNSQYASIQVRSTGLDTWFKLSAVDHFWTPGSPTR